MKKSGEMYHKTYASVRRNHLKIRTPMPKLTGEELVLNATHNGEQLNKVTLVYFWSISCNQCEHSIAKLKKLEQIFSGKLSIVTVHMPRSEEDKQIDLIKQKTEKLQITFPVYIDNKLKISNEFTNQIVPAFYVFDHEGLLRFYKAGMTTDRLLQQKIQRII